MSGAIILPIAMEQRYGEVFITPPCTVILRCALCPKNYRIYHAFQQHILSHFAERRNQPDQQEETQYEKSTNEMEFVKVEQNAELLAEEATFTMKPSADIKGDEPSRPKPPETNKRFPCSICHATFATPYAKQSHELRHYGIRRFACDLCDRRYYKNADLKDHQRTHTGERPFVCAQCGKGFIQLTQLRLHEIRHTGQKTVPCDSCEKLFYTKKDLEKHSHVHKQERKYACSECEARFTRPAALRGHKKLHENAKEFKCDLCELAFNQRPALFLHRRNKHKVVSNRGFTQTQKMSENKD